MTIFTGPVKPCSTRGWVRNTACGWSGRVRLISATTSNMAWISGASRMPAGGLKVLTSLRPVGLVEMVPEHMIRVVRCLSCCLAMWDPAGRPSE